MWALAFLALAYFHCTKNAVFHWGFLQYVWPNMSFCADLVKFTEEILNGKLHFLCSVCLGFSDEFWGAFSVECKEFWFSEFVLISKNLFWYLLRFSFWFWFFWRSTYLRYCSSLSKAINRAGYAISIAFSNRVSMDSVVKSILVACFKRKPFPDSEPLMFSLKSQSRLFTWFLRSYILTNLFSIVSLSMRISY